MQSVPEESRSRTPMPPRTPERLRPLVDLDISVGGDRDADTGVGSRPRLPVVRVDGVPLHALGEKALRAWRLRHVGLVFQDLRLLESLSAL